MKTLFLPAVLLVAASFAHASESPAAKNEAKLVGAWQQGMTAKLQKASPEQLKQARASGVLGHVIDYGADHTFTMYPKCGPKRDELVKAGLSSVKGKWQLEGDDQLVIMVEGNGKSMKSKIKITWADDQLVLVDPNGKVAGKAGRYKGNLPPAC